ncbi:Uncharacterised protein [Enterobacter cloacae]|nr:Uncharacterised protein [Enterobacter cloacae]
MMVNGNWSFIRVLRHQVQYKFTSQFSFLIRFNMNLQACLLSPLGRHCGLTI